ncbi:hypothetical protein OG946_34660 [Streptomyces sp. NBC_01808]|uniref:hypothetical protein n=1 Tax=Streptomyces sp. NBC_01808 TaxID=2975947 RepID=UPI002DDB3CDB|nr:hypothetical protein [Streptomyces sp. NBC_01808]WSA42065.1 hypothetical protein OG946_34660 [Streptomyces sp. NBC_01808]
MQQSPSTGNAFTNSFSTKYRLLDADAYWMDFPYFRHCNTSTARVLCTVPQP